MINIDVNSPIPVVETAYSHELNAKGGRKLEIAFYKDGVIFPVTTSANRTVTATFVCNGFLIAEDISTEPKSDNVVILDISSTDNYTIIPGTMLIELKVTGRNGEVVCPPSAMIVEVKPSIRDNAKVTPESLGTVAEVIKEVAAARGIYDNLGKRLDEFDESLENDANNLSLFKQTYSQDLQELHAVDNNLINEIAKKANFKNISYSAGGTGGLNTACDPDTIYNVCFNAPCNNVAQGTKGILFATDENTQILITDKGDIFYRNYNLTEDIWGEFTSVISNKVSSVDGVLPDNNGNVNLLVKCGHTTDLASCTDESKVYYFDSGMSTLNGNTLSGLSGIGGAIGFVKKIHTGWLFVSSGVGAIKTNRYISENGTIELVGGTFDYNDLNNKPTINDVELTGNKTLSDLGLYNKEQVDEIIANQSVSGSGTLNINSSNGPSDIISSATYYYVKRGELVTLFCSIKFNAGTCNYADFNGLPFNYNNKVGQLRTYAATNKSEMFRVAVKSGMLFIASSTATRTQDEELNFSITYTTNS